MDPSTNGINKLSPLTDNVLWENEISLRFLNTTYACDSDDNSYKRSKDLDFKGNRKHSSSRNFEMNRQMMNYCEERQHDDELVVYSNPTRKHSNTRNFEMNHPF